MRKVAVFDTNILLSAIGWKGAPADPDDDKVLECATLAGATHVVTGDRRHLLPMSSFQGIRIITAAEFLKVAASP